MSSTEGQGVMAAAPGISDPADELGPNTIEASRVIGTDVYNIDGDRMGHIHDLVLGKLDGQVRYAVMAFGGFLGIGEDHHPLPWHMLKYDTRQGGYVVGVTIDQLEGAPKHSAAAAAPWGDPDYGRSVDDYWKPTAA